MSIIPSPGAPPNVQPTNNSINVGFDGYTITSGTEIYENNVLSILSGWNSRVTNNGIAWLVQPSYTDAFFVIGGLSEVNNSGSIYIEAEFSANLGSCLFLVNTGSIFSVTREGWARVAEVGYGHDGYVENSGLIAAQSLGLDPNDSNYWNATALLTRFGTQIRNLAGGQILAEAPGIAIAIESYGGDASQPSEPVVINSGLIESNATRSDGISIAIFCNDGAIMPFIIVNNGTIRADIAIYGSSLSFPGSIQQISNQTGGLIEGQLLLGTGNDEISNEGSIIGDVEMGSGADLFHGSGTVSGMVDMGFDNDTYLGGVSADRAAGGRSNDILHGGAGDDFLLGGFGDDELRGDAGNDGLFGEWGHDRIYTSSGDYVETGDGHDRVVLGDYSFEAIHGGAGIDILEMAPGTRNFSLSEIVASSRVDGFEIIALAADQQLAIGAAALTTFTGGGNSMRIDAAASNTIHLAGQWTQAADLAIGSTIYEVWTLGSATVIVAAAAVVAQNSTPLFGAFDAVAGGAAALRPGTASGLDYSDTAELVYYLPVGGDFTVEAEEIFYSAGAAPFVATEYSSFTNNGTILSIDNIFPSARGVEVSRNVNIINAGLILVQELSQLGSLYYYPSIAIIMGSIDSSLYNTGEVSVYSVPGRAIAVQQPGLLHNEGFITAISENSRAIAVNALLGGAFSNTGVIYAEAGGLGAQASIEGDHHVPASYAATGVQVYGSLTNDGTIIAALGPNANPDLPTLGIYVINRFADPALPAGITNNGTIEGKVAIKFEENYAYNYNHWVINNGLLNGHVEFEDGNDSYDGANGTTTGTVFGNAGNDNFIGGTEADRFDGGAGDDSMNGGGDLDWAIYGSAAGAVLVDLRIALAQNTGAAGSDTLIGIENLGGSKFDDILLGNSAANILDGAAGNDRLSGYAGNDHYLVDAIGDLVFEVAGEGTDTVESTVSYYLHQNIENLILSAGAGASFGVGNELANLMSGNDGANLLLAGSGDDTIYGGTGNDQLFGEDGADALNGDGGIDYLAAGNGNDFLYGGADADALYGEDGDDLLDGGASFHTDILVGGAGNDTLRGDSGQADYDLLDGGSGNDTYWVDTGDDLTFEAVGGGIDTVHANVTVPNAGVYLYANLENLVLEGTTAFGVGNELDNQLTGSASGNYLLGGLGNDRIAGMAGNDVLFGEGGADTFVFGAGSGQDVIGDFSVAEDVIEFATTFISFAQVQANMVQVGADGAIDLGGGNLIVLHGVTMANLTAANFAFAPAAQAPMAAPLMVAALTFAVTPAETFAEHGLARWQAELHAEPLFG